MGILVCKRYAFRAPPPLAKMTQSQRDKINESKEYNMKTRKQYTREQLVILKAASQLKVLKSAALAKKQMIKVELQSRRHNASFILLKRSKGVNGSNP